MTVKELKDVLHFLLSVIEGSEPHAPARVAEHRALVDAAFAGPEPEAEAEAEPEPPAA